MHGADRDHCDTSNGDTFAVAWNKQTWTWLSQLDGRLNRKVRDAAAAYRWRVVGASPAFLTRGYCNQSESLVTGLVASFLKQNQDGPFHPTPKPIVWRGISTPRWCAPGSRPRPTAPARCAEARRVDLPPATIYPTAARRSRCGRVQSRAPAGSPSRSPPTRDPACAEAAPGRSRDGGVTGNLPLLLWVLRQRLPDDVKEARPVDRDAHVRVRLHPAQSLPVDDGPPQRQL